MVYYPRSVGESSKQNLHERSLGNKPHLLTDYLELVKIDKSKII